MTQLNNALRNQKTLYHISYPLTKENKTNNAINYKINKIKNLLYLKKNQINLKKIIKDSKV